MAGYVSKGSVKGPSSSTDNAFVRWDGTTGKTLQSSNVTLSDAGVLNRTSGNIVIQTTTSGDLQLNPAGGLTSSIPAGEDFVISSTTTNAAGTFRTEITTATSGAVAVTGKTTSSGLGAGGTVFGVESQLVNNAGDGANSVMAAYLAAAPTDNGGADFTGLLVDTGYDIGLDINSGTMDWDGAGWDVDASGEVDFTISAGNHFDLNTSITDAGAAWNAFDMTATVSPTGANAQNHIGLESGITLSTNQNLTSATGGLQGSYIAATNAGTGTVTLAYGANNNLFNTSTGTITTGVCTSSLLYNGSTGAITTATGYFANLINANASGTITTYAAFSADINTNAGTITTYLAFDAIHTASATNYFFLSYGANFLSQSSIKVTPDRGTTTDYVATQGLPHGQGADIASANDMAVPTADYQDVTGNTQINTMAATNVNTGDVVILQFDSNPVVKHATAGTGAQFYMAGAGDWNAPAAGDTLTVVYDGTYWRETSRTT